MKIISPSLHGIIDYLMCGVLLALPTAYDFTGTYANVCYVLAGGYFVIALLTNMPFGLFKWIPFRMHGGVELVSALMLIASPWIFDFAPNASARNLFIILGVAFLLVYAFTRWDTERETSAQLEIG